METLNCILCSSESRLVKKDFVGIMYFGVDGKTEKIETDRPYDIYHCDICDTRFASPWREVDYEKIYAETDLYKELEEFARKIQADPDPYWTLIGRGQQYYAAFDFVKDKKGLIGLDVGCGYGYLAFAMGTLGHKFAGLEVSESVVKFAKELYGEGFFKVDIHNAELKEIPDAILALEVIEHLTEPLKFVRKGIELLKSGGSMLITTPDREYVENRKTGTGESMLALGWNGEFPPIHWSMFSKKSFEWIAKELNAKLSFTNFPGGPAQTIGAIITKP
jgi:SAM-dependent methyltransferase